MQIKNINQLTKIRNENKKKKIGLCHGVFDILHNGHIQHFKNAKKKVDILIVSITEEKFVNKGPRQPYNNNKKRINILNSIKYLDYTYLNNSQDARKIINILKPDIYFKGPDYLKTDNHGNLDNELKILKKNKGKIFFTKTKLESSTKLFNQLYNWNSDQKKFLKKIKNISDKKINNYFENISKLEINLIGEPIIDKYEYCDILGTTTKDPAISVLSKKTDLISGGVIAVAKMASKFCKKVNLITYGNSGILKKLLTGYNNIKLINISSNQNIQCKTRLINSNREEKLIQVTNFKKNFFNKNEIMKCILYLKKLKKEKLIICDFGLGLFENKILDYINSSELKKYLNVQTNSINLGFNLFTKYKKYEYLSLDTREWSLGLKTENLDLNEINRFVKNYKYLAITKGKDGSILKTKNHSFDCPVFVKSAKDTTGSGDAFFIITSLLIMLDIDKILIPFIGNVYAGMHAQTLGNQKIVSNNELRTNINSLIKF